MKNREKIYQSIPFEGMTARERYDFARFLSFRGANFRTMLDRIMYRGYNEWERVGIREIIQEFDDREISPRHLFATLDSERRKQLLDKLTSMGMCRRTAKHRFSCGSFKEWEMTGIDTLLTEWQSTEKS